MCVSAQARGEGLVAGGNGGITVVPGATGERGPIPRGWGASREEARCQGAGDPRAKLELIVFHVWQMDTVRVAGRLRNRCHTFARLGSNPKSL